MEEKSGKGRRGHLTSDLHELIVGLKVSGLAHLFPRWALGLSLKASKMLRTYTPATWLSAKAQICIS